MTEESTPYADIIDLPHHVSIRHSQMPMEKRAAQFSPFAAVSGHDDAICETARLTEERLELSEEEIDRLNRKLRWLQDHIKEHPKITVTYFLPDKKKSGGAYVTVTGSAKRIDEVGQMLVMKDELEIPIQQVLCITL